MKINRTAIAAAASITAVVLAGTAALAANFGILGATDDGIDNSITPTVVSMAPTTQADVQTETTQPAPEVLAYQVDGIGVVTLDRSGDGLELNAVDVDPAAWTWIEDVATNGVQVTFTSSSNVVTFAARVEGGQVVVEVTDVTPATVSSSYDDSDDGHESDDDHGSEEYDD